MTLGMRASASFTDYLIGLGLNPTTILYYARHVANAQRWLAESGTDLMRARAVEIAAFAQTIVNSHSTRGQVAAALNHYWDHVGRFDAPRRAIRVPPQPLMVCRAIEPVEASRLRDMALCWYPAGLAVLMGLYLALRRAEIACSEWQRFDRDMEWYRVTGKRDKTATLPVHEVLRRQLEPHRQPVGWIFPGRFGGHVNVATVWEWTRLVADRAGIGDLTPHQLRHTSLATANDNLGDLRAVQTFARHERPQTTSGYTRTTAKTLRAVSEALDYDSA